MPTFQDLHIFVTGVVGRAMGSGKFEPEQIPVLCEAAYNAFKLTFGEPDSAPRLAQQAPPTKTYEPPAVILPPRSYGAPVAQEPGPVDGKPFLVWANDKLKMGKNKRGPGGKPWSEVTWAEAHRSLAGGSSQALGWLSFMANLKDNDPQYARQNATMRARAQAVIDSVQTEQCRDETPFG